MTELELLQAINTVLTTLSGMVVQTAYFIAGLLSALIAVVSWRA